CRRSGTTGQTPPAAGRRGQGPGGCAACRFPKLSETNFNAPPRRLVDLLKFAAMHSADRAFIAETTAKMLLEVKAVLFSEGKPFIFTSGWASPVYIDCRKLIFYPRIRGQLVDFATATLARDAGFEQ